MYRHLALKKVSSTLHSTSTMCKLSGGWNHLSGPQTGNIKVGGAESICVNLLLGADFDVAACLRLDSLLLVGGTEVLQVSTRFDVLLSKDSFPTTPGSLDKPFRLSHQLSDEPLPI